MLFSHRIRSTYSEGVGREGGRERERERMREREGRGEEEERGHNQ